MTDTRRPPACRYDRSLNTRVTRRHRDDCPTQQSDPGPCPGRDGCAPCTAPHCLICTKEHTDNDHPHTCPDCLGKIRTDLHELDQAYADLAREAIDGGSDGHLVAGAPIPGGDAAVLTGPTVRLDQLRTGRGYNTADMAKIHLGRKGKARDPIPPLAVLAQWEDIYRTWFGFPRAGTATVPRVIRFLDDRLTKMANGPAVADGPDWVMFTRQVRSLRASLERALHDEREPEQGVECFECGDQLVRRFRDPQRCRHTTTARRQLQAALLRQADAQDWLRVLGTYPEIDAEQRDLRAARGPAASLVADACRPCPACQARATGQGGLDDPRAGRSWECPGCRKEYTPGEYATATRRDLLENGDQGDGWTHVRMAAEAATTLVGLQVPEVTVRKWLDRGKVAGLCEWTAGRPWGQRLVFWPDVAAAAVDAVARVQAADERRRQRAVVEQRWRDRVAAGEKPKVAAKLLGIDKAWLARLLDTVAA